MGDRVTRTGTLVLLLALGFSPTNPVASAAPQTPLKLTVNDNADVVAAQPLTDGICATAYNNGQPNGICTLRAAVMKANHWPGGSAVITLPAQAPGVNFTLTIPALANDDETTGDLNITTTITIQGGGASRTIIDGNGSVTHDRVILVGSSGSLILSGVTVQGGTDNILGLGGGIGNLGSLTLISSTVSSNQSSNSSGGGIGNYGNSLIVDSTIVSNTAYDFGGLGNFYHNATLINSTISHNGTRNDGGGIGNTSPGTVSLYNVTVADNVADSNLDGVGTGGGIFNDKGSLQLQNSIVADNLASDFDPERTVWFFTPNDCGGSPTSQDYNLVSDTSGCAFTPTVHDHTNVAAHLGPLQDNGGPTWTYALLPGSPAIDAGHPNGSAGVLSGCMDNVGAILTTDQRGYPRPAFGGHSFTCDIGAFELQQIVDLPLVRR